MPIPTTATKYTVDSDSRLSRDGKRLRVRRTDNGVFGQLVCDDGIRRRVNLANLNNPERVITPEHVFGKEKAKVHPDYPDYAVTNYGDVYCLRNSKSGIRANTIYIVPDFLHGPTNRRYISIRRPNGTRYQIRLYRFVKQVWGDNAQFNEDE